MGTVRTVIEIAHVQGGAIEMLAVIFSSPPLTEGNRSTTFPHTTDAGANVASPFILPSLRNQPEPSPLETRPLFSSLLFSSSCHQPPNNNNTGSLTHGSPRRDEGDRKATALYGGSRGGEGEANG